MLVETIKKTKKKKTDGGTTEKGASEDNLVIATLSDAAQLDPQRSTDVPSANIQTNIFEGLVKRTKMKISLKTLQQAGNQVDETTWEFKLREGC